MSLPSYGNNRDGTGRIYYSLKEGTWSDDDSIACEGTWNPNGYLPAADPPSPIAGVRGCPAGSPTSMDLPVCEDGLWTGCDRDAFGSGYRVLEVQIIQGLPRSGGQVYNAHTPAASPPM